MCPPRSITIVGLALALSVLVAPDRARARRPAPENPYPGYQSATYVDPAHWLCRPDMDDVCDHELEATIVNANGRVKEQKFRAARKPKIDCFYVYPTISTDPGGNSDFVPGDDQELFVVRQQAARLGAECRVFAPVYRSVTLTALLAILGGNPTPADRELAYNDVVDAWKHYIANDNDGRGVILIGHSQGAGILTELVKNEIDPSPVLRARLLSAMLLGTSVQVPDGADVGGDFQNVPLCRSKRDVGCIISYASFRDTAPPPANSFFGVSDGAGMHAACTNPAALEGGSKALHPYFPADGASLAIIQVPRPDWVDPSKGVEITTPFVTLPKFVEAECAEKDGFNYLSLHVLSDPADPRIDDIGGDLTPEWGMHLIDVNVAMGDLVTVAKNQARAFRRVKR
jgi:hypothetical protein